MPASNQKIVTGAVALAQLGAEYRWTTTLLRARRDPERRARRRPRRARRRRSLDQLAHARRRARAAARPGGLAARARDHAHPRPRRRRAVAVHRRAARLRLGVGRPRRAVRRGSGRALLQRGVHARSSCARARARAIPRERHDASGVDASAADRPRAHRRALPAPADSARNRPCSRSATTRRTPACCVAGTIVVGDTRGARARASRIIPAPSSPRCARRCAPAASRVDETRMRQHGHARFTRRDALPAPARRAPRASRSRRRTRSASSCSRRWRCKATGVGRADSAQRVVSRQLVAWGAEAGRIRRARRQRPVAAQLRDAAHARSRCSTRCGATRTSASFYDALPSPGSTARSTSACAARRRRETCAPRRATSTRRARSRAT